MYRSSYDIKLDCDAVQNAIIRFRYTALSYFVIPSEYLTNSIAILFWYSAVLDTVKHGTGQHDVDDCNFCIKYLL